MHKALRLTVAAVAAAAVSSSAFAQKPAAEAAVVEVKGETGRAVGAEVEIQAVTPEGYSTECWLQLPGTVRCASQAGRYTRAATPGVPRSWLSSRSVSTGSARSSPARSTPLSIRRWK